MQEEASAKDVRQAYVLDHVDYAKRLAKRFYLDHQPIAAEYDDLVAAAYLGLCDAAYRFDPEKGVNFKTFSFLRIRGEMYDLLRKFTPTPRKRTEPKNMGANSIEVLDNGEQQEVFQSLDNPDEPSGDERIHELLGLVTRGACQSQHYELSYLEDSSPALLLERQALRQYVHTVVNGLSPVERQVVYLKYFEDLSFSQISEMLNGVHKSGLSRVHRRAIRRMKERVDVEELCC